MKNLKGEEKKKNMLWEGKRNKKTNIIGNLENRGLRVLIDCNNSLGVLHSCYKKKSQKPKPKSVPQQKKNKPAKCWMAPEIPTAT